MIYTMEQQSLFCFVFAIHQRNLGLRSTGENEMIDQNFRDNLHLVMLNNNKAK